MANTSSMMLHRHLVEAQPSTVPCTEKSPETEPKKAERVNATPIADSTPKKAKKATKKAK